MTFARSLFAFLLLPALFASMPSAGLAQTPADTSSSAAAGRMLYRDTPAIRGSIQACVQCHAAPALQRRGQSLQEQQDFIRCAIQGGCGGAQMAVYPYGNMAQFQGLLSGQDIAHLAKFIREPNVVAPWPRLADSRIAAGRRSVGTQAVFSLTLENRGETPLPISGADVSGDARRDFSVDTRQCPANLGVNGQCTIEVTHKPSCGRARSGLLTLRHGGPPLQVSAQLVGTADGTTPPQLESSHSSIQFDASMPLQHTLTLELRNSCGDSLDASRIRLDGPFELVNSSDACRSLGADQSCTLQFRRSQANAAALATRTGSGTVTIVTTASNSKSAEERIAISAAALPSAALRWQPIQALSDTLVGASSAQEFARLENTSSTRVVLSQLSLTHPSIALAPNAPQHCGVGTSLEPGASCVLRASFAPTVAGLQVANLQLLAAPGAVAQAFEVSVRGVTPPAVAVTGGGAVDSVFGLLIALALLLWIKQQWPDAKRRRNGESAKR